MSRLTDLIAHAKAQNLQLGVDLEREFKVLSSRLPYGLNFERHRPEAVELPQRPVRRGDKVQVLSERRSAKKGDQRLWVVKRIGKVGDSRVANLELLGDAESHLPLHKWFMALAIVVDAKKGISANQLKEHLGIGSYRTAWYMAHRIRKAMEDNSGAGLKGIVEVDETYIGGKSKRRGGSVRNQKARNEKFDMVISMRERKGRVKFVHIPDGKAASIGKAVDQHIDPKVNRIIYRWRSGLQLRSASCFRPKHQAVNHNIQWIVPGTDIHTNTVESSFSHLKRGLIGSFHRVSIKHLHRYLSEFEFSFNVRKDADRFSNTLRRMPSIPPMPYVELIAGSEDFGAVLDGTIGSRFPGLPFIADVFSGFCFSMRCSSASNCFFSTFI